MLTGILCMCVYMCKTWTIHLSISAHKIKQQDKVYELVYKVMAFLWEHLKDHLGTLFVNNHNLCIGFTTSLSPTFCFVNRLEGTKVLKGLQCENVKTLHDFWHGQCCTCSPTLQNFTNVGSCSWYKNVSGHWNAEKLQYKCNSYDSTKSLFLYILLFFFW